MTSGTRATPTTTTSTPGPDDDARKAHVLTQHTASLVRSISDAVVAKDGEPFFLCPPDGQLPCGSRHGYGLYHHDCRFLDGYELTIAGSSPGSLAATEAQGSRIVLELTNAETQLPNGSRLRKDQLGITWGRSLQAGIPGLVDDIEFRNYEREPASFPVHVRFGARFEDVFVIRGLISEQTGTVLPPRWEAGELVLAYRGADGIDRSLRLTFIPRPAETHLDGATFDVAVPGRGDARIRVVARLEEQPRPGAVPIEPREAPTEARLPATEAADRPSENGWIGVGWPTRVRTSSLVLAAALTRSLADLRLLRATLGGYRYYEAGIPWFATLFGRDALIAGLQSLPFDPGPVADTLRLLAQRQGTAVDHWRDEAPGKILHELRIGELARLGEIPHSPYYGSVDATPLFLCLLGRHAAWTGKLDLFEELRDSVEAALGWLDGYADADSDGFIDYDSQTTKGLANQGWKDSGDGIIDGSGRIADPPIALVEVQAYAYRAWLEVAELFGRAGEAERARTLRDRAERLRRQFEARFWSEDLGCYVLALARDGACEVVASNAGHALWAGIAAPDRARRVAERLLGADMFNGWGIRTLSADAAAYHPIGYHLGTVWPHDNALIADGFKRYGLDGAAEEVFVAMLETAQHFPHARLPECFAGYDRADYGVPVKYPVACHPQAWASGALPSLLITNLGFQPDAFGATLRVVRPRLPAFVRRAEVAGLRVGEATVHLAFDNTAAGTQMSVIERQGDLEVAIEAATEVRA